MNRSSVSLRSASFLSVGLVALACGASAVPMTAAAQPAPQGASPVAVESRRAEPAAPLRPDLSTVCPAAQAELPEALASTWQHVGQAGEVTAHLTVDGDRVTGVRAEGGHPRQRWAVRWALSALDCRADRPGAQRFAVRVRFADPAAVTSSGPQTVALLPAVSGLSGLGGLAGLSPAASAAR